MKGRIALYARVSTKDNGQEYENQLQELRQFVAQTPLSSGVPSTWCIKA